MALLVYLAATQSEAQEQRKLPRIGVLVSGSEASSRLYLDGLRKGLAEVGIAEGTGVVLDIKYAEGRMDLLDSLAIELVKSAPQLLFAGGDQGSSAMKRAAAGRLPIVAVTCDALAADEPCLPLQANWIGSWTTVAMAFQRSCRSGVTGGLC